MNEHMTIEQMKDEVRTELQNGGDLEKIKDRVGEWIDGYLPIYNNQIMKEWQDMPHEYDDRGGQELGTDGSIGIIGLMSLDLYLYYSDLFNRAMDDLEEEMASV
jgi:hypothetical protein